MAFQDRIFEYARDTNQINRSYAAFAFRSFSDFPDKEKAWTVLEALSKDENSVVRQNAAFVFRSFSDFPDKEKAWTVLEALSEDENSVVRQNAAIAFRSFSDFPDKEKAWTVLEALSEDENSVVRQNAAIAFRSFSDFPDKEKAWTVLEALSKDENSVVRQNAAIAFRSFSDFPDKEKAWTVLEALSEDENSVVRQNAAFVFRSFSDFPDKEKAWTVLEALSEDENSVVRQNSARAFTSFSDFPDKEKAWTVLEALSKDENSVVRQNAAFAFQTSFSDFPDKEKAWTVLEALSKDKDSVVRQNAAVAFRSFSDFPDKEKAWTVLEVLSKDENSMVRRNAVFVFHPIYDKFSYKEELLKIALKLTEDQSRGVKAVSNYSLAKIYIYKALKAETEQEFKEIYNEAIKFFEIAYNLIDWDITKFCFNVHSLFYRILIGDVNNVDDIRNNINLWKDRPIKSEERQHLLEILESLGNVLEETLIAKEKGGNAWEFRKKILPYCNKADELIDSLKHEGIKKIATKARVQVKEDYYKTINRLLKNVNSLIDEPEPEPEHLEKQLFPIIREYCELITEPIIRDKIKLDINEIQAERNREIRIKLGLRLLKDIKYQLEILSKHKDEELEHKDEILDIKNIESKKGWDIFRFFQSNNISDNSNSSKLKIRLFFERLAISFTIAGLIWTFIYAGLNELEYNNAMRESSIVFLISINIILIILYKKG